jgi:hypothetical protein
MTGRKLASIDGAAGSTTIAGGHRRGERFGEHVSATSSFSALMALAAVFLRLL